MKCIGCFSGDADAVWRGMSLCEECWGFADEIPMAVTPQEMVARIRDIVDLPDPEDGQITEEQWRQGFHQIAHDGKLSAKVEKIMYPDSGEDEDDNAP